MTLGEAAANMPIAGFFLYAVLRPSGRWSFSWGASRREPAADISVCVNGLATGQRTDRAGAELALQQATMQALMRTGVDPVIARAAADCAEDSQAASLGC